MPAKYSEEFTRDAVAFVLVQGMSQKQVYVDLGISNRQTTPPYDSPHTTTRHPSERPATPISGRVPRPAHRPVPHARRGIVASSGGVGGTDPLTSR